MKKIITLLFAVTTFSSQSFAQTDTHRKVHAGFIYPVSSNGSNAAHISNDFSFHALSGVSKNENGVSIAGISNHIKQEARGIQIAGLINQVGDSAHGVQISGLGNIIKKNASGLQIAGLTNISGNANNQISGLLNVADDVKGIQIAGLINKAGNVKGVQLSGLLNIALSSDYPIGIINVIKNGKQTLGLSYDETGTGLLTYRSGGGVLYGLIGLGYSLNSKRSKDYYGFEAGIGAHIIKSKNFLLNGEVFSQSLTDFNDFSYNKNGVRLLPALRIAERIEIFAGPAFNVTRFDTDKNQDLYNRYFWTKEKRGHFTGMSIGYMAGIQIRL